ncbi:MAG: hypothetical protein AAF399_00860 [Bacteroidota bacterium]
MNNKTRLVRIILFVVFVLPLLVFGFLYLGTEQVFDSVPYEYHLVEGGDTVFHGISTFEFQEPDGTPITPEDLKGHITILSFFSTQDVDKVTTVLFGNLKRVYDNIEWELDPPYRFVSVNMGDSLAEVAAFSQDLEVDKENWKIVTGSQEDIYRLATQGLVIPDFIRHTPGSEPFTAQTIALLDKEGKVRRYFVGTDLGEERKLQEDLIAMLRLEYPEEAERMRLNRSEQ